MPPAHLSAGRGCAVSEFEESGLRAFSRFSQKSSYNCGVVETYVYGVARTGCPIAFATGRNELTPRSLCARGHVAPVNIEQLVHIDR